MKKKVIFAVYILALILLVSCTDIDYDSKTEKAQNQYNEGKVLSAVRTLDEAIEINDVNYKAYAMRGYFYWQLKNYGNAVSDYEKAIERGGKYYNYSLGMLLIDIGRPLEAADYLCDYLKYDDSNAEVYILLSNIYEQAGEDEKAEDTRKEGYKVTGDKRLRKQH